MMETQSNVSDFKKRVTKENKRLRKRYEALPEDSMDILDGLIDRAAYLRITLEDIEKDIAENGRVSAFQQSKEVEPYERERPVVGQYVKLSNNYTNIIKQLDSKLPKLENTPVDDGFDDFRFEREE